jgi:DNA repair exonuclease SbcCD nuclease subunit
MNPVRVQERRDDINKNFSEIVNYALKNKPDIFIISGDVFDRAHPTNHAMIFLVKKVKLLVEAGIHVFIIGGNHDVPKIGKNPPLAIDVLGSAGLATVFSMSDRFLKKLIEIDGESVCISGKSFFTQEETINPFKDTNVPLEGKYNITILHASLKGLNVVSTIPEIANYNPFYAEDIPSGVTYLALGHFHNFFERNYKDCKIVNPGSIERMTWAEINEEKKFVYAEIHKDHVSIEPIKLETRTMESKDLDLTECSTSDLNKYIIEQLEDLTDSSKMLKLNLKGEIPQDKYFQIKINEILRYFSEKFFHLEINRKDLGIKGIGRIFIERIDNPMEAFKKRLDILISNAQSFEEKVLLEQVKEIGIKYLEGFIE